MATITRKSGEAFSSPEKVQEFLKQKGIEYRHWQTPQNADPLLGQAVLDDSEKENALKLLESRFLELQNEFGYVARDLVVLHKDVPGIDGMLAKFDKLHYHTDDEVRYIVDGAGVFGFSIGGEEFEVHVEKNDFISVPANTHHYFTLDSLKRIKAVRYFKDQSGWTPIYV